MQYTSSSFTDDWALLMPGLRQRVGIVSSWISPSIPVCRIQRWAITEPTPEIPTTPSSMGALMDQLTRLAARLDKLPLEEVVEQVRASLPVLTTLSQARALMATLGQETAPQAQATLRQAQVTLAPLEQVRNSDSPAQKDLHGGSGGFHPSVPGHEGTGGHPGTSS